VRLKPQDSFDLIRLLARSQSDARKAIAELVQNSLDASARHIAITWFSEKGARCLRIRDDGAGVFPELSRDEALRTIAQTIGRSHKRELSAAERHRQMMLGKYGIGLLGFWCVARVMEIRTRVGGGEARVLRLVEEEPHGEVLLPRSGRLRDEPTYTEVLLREIKESVSRQVRPARLQAYLAGELRGQLLQRGVEIRIHDRIARGRAPKEFLVRPRAYLGIHLEDVTSLEVPGHEEARVELYCIPPGEARRGVVSLSCGGTTVLDDISLVDVTDPAGSAREPWASGRLEGVIDFPDLDVAPGTRRGFVPNDAALDFLVALVKLEQVLGDRVLELEQERARQRHEHVAREIRRAFAPVARRLPHYELFDVQAGERRAPADAGSVPGGEPVGEATGAVGDAGAPGAPADAPGAAGSVEIVTEPIEPGGSAELFAPGPLAHVRIVPARVRIEPQTQRRFRARTEDADGRPVRDDVEFRWALEGPGELEPEGGAAVYRAPADHADAMVVVEAQQHEHEARAEASVQVRENASAPGLAAGVPEPEPVNAPSEPWRSRIAGNTWQFNEGHADYLAVAADDQRRLRYLIHLFAKELVLRNFGSPADGTLLERMVEVLTHLGEGRAR
jgi:hypothetical protein